MTLRTFLNITAGIKAVTMSNGKFFNVEPEQTSPPLEVTDADLERLKSTGYFKVSLATQEDVEAAKSPAPAPAAPAPPEPGPNAAERLLAQADDGGRDDDDTGGDDDQTGGGGGDDFDAMSDEALRSFLTDRDGKAPHHKLGRDKLLLKAREGDTGGDDEEDGV